MGLLAEINELYDLLNRMGIKPKYGGIKNVTPEKRQAVKDKIDKLDK